MPRNRRLLLLTRYPEPGKVKTRLVPRMGKKAAAQLHRRMTEHAVSIVMQVEGVNQEIQFTGAPRSSFKAWLGSNLEYRKQVDGDLGERLRASFEASFKQGNCSVVAIGSDIPSLTPGLIADAFQGLERNDVVIGPADDGGYYLVGMNKAYPEIFSGIEWGTRHVYSQTREVIEQLGLKCFELSPLYDVDLPGDLDRLMGDPRFSDIFSSHPLISVVIPTLNEASRIGKLVNNLQKAERVEVIVADGGSGDGTSEIARKEGACVLEVSGSRAAQQNAGAAVSSGRILLFLHADTILPETWTEHIRTALESPDVAGGSFGFRTDGSGMGIRLVERGANIRSTVFRLPYGDQGLFMEKRVFNDIGGFDDLPIMEDFQIVRKLRRRGRLVTLPLVAVTSSRRWKKIGILRTSILNQLVVAGFLAGVSPERLARFYRRVRKG